MSSNLTINIAEPLVKFTNGNEYITISCGSICQLQNAIKSAYPDLEKAIFEGKELHGFVNLVVNGSILEPGSDASLNKEDKISFLCSISGG